MTTCGRTWCVEEWTHVEETAPGGATTTAHRGETTTVGSGAETVEVRLMQLDGEPEPVVLVNDTALAPAQAMTLGGHLIGLASEAGTSREHIDVS